MSEQIPSSQRLANLVVSSRVARWQWRVLLALAILGVLAGSWVLRSVRQQKAPRAILPDISSLVPAKWRREVERFAKVNRDFGFDRAVIIAVKAPHQQDVLSSEMIAFNQALTRALKKMPAVERVISLPSSLSIRVKKQTMVVKKLFPDKLSHYTSEAAKQLRSSLPRDPLFRGSLISPDGRVALTICLLQKDLGSKGHLAFAKDLFQVMDEIGGLAPEARIGLSGQPMVEALMIRALKRESPWLYPMAAACFLFFLLCLMRSWRVLVWWSLWSIASGTWLALLLWFLFAQIHVAMWLVPFLWFWVGLAWSVEFVVAERLSRVDYQAARRYVRSLRVGLLSAGVLMAAGSLAWGAWGWAIVAETALVSVLSLFVLSLFAWMLWPRPPGTSRERAASASYPSAFMQEPPTPLTGEAKVLWQLEGDGVARWLYQSRRLWMMGTLVLLIIAGMGLRHLSWGRQLQGFLPKLGLLAQGESIVRQHFGGETPLLIRLVGDLRHPAVLRGLDRASRLMEVDEQISHPQSIAGLIRHLHSIMKGSPRIPNERKQISALWVLLEGQPALASLLRNEGKDGILQARVRLTSLLEERGLVDRIDRYLQAIPRRAQRVDLRKLPVAMRRALVQKRALWVAEGVGIWSRREGGGALDRTIQARLATDLLPFIEQAQAAAWRVSSSYRLRVALQLYLASEGCDIELTPELRKKVLTSLAAALPKGGEISLAIVNTAMRRALQGSSAASDKDGLRYASRAIVGLLIAQARAFQREKMLDAVLSVLKAQPGFLGSSLGQRLSLGGKVAAKLLKELEAPLYVVQDPNWFRTDRGKPLVRVIHTGLHRFWLPMAQGAKAMIWPTLGAFAILVLLLVGLLFRSMGEAWKVLWPLGATTLAVLGMMGWFQIPLDLFTLLLLFTVLLFCLFLFVRLRYASRSVRRSLQAGMPLFGQRIAPLMAASTQQVVLFLAPLSFLCFSVIPMLFEVGMLWGMGMVFALWMGVGTLFADLGAGLRHVPSSEMPEDTTD
ncbi:MAG: hypothetical protein H6728_08540 [Myxococcales bacterium]|nr:hypothetical protein [Myxococcales bacterium]